MNIKCVRIQLQYHIMQCRSIEWSRGLQERVQNVSSHLINMSHVLLVVINY